LSGPPPPSTSEELDLDELKFFATPLEEYGWIKHFF